MKQKKKNVYKKREDFVWPFRAAVVISVRAMRSMWTCDFVD